MMPPFRFVFPTNRIAYFVEVSLFYLAQQVKLETLVPILKNVDPMIFTIIVLGGALSILLLIRLLIYIYDNAGDDILPTSSTDTSISNNLGANNNEPLTKEEKTNTESTKNASYSKAWIVLYFIFLIILIGAGFALFNILYKNGILQHNYDFFEIVSSLLKYAGSVTMLLLAVVIVILFLIEMIRIIVSRIQVFALYLKEDAKNDSVPLFALSAILDIVVCYLTYKFTGFTIDSFYDFVNSSEYLALPLLMLFVGIVFIIFLRLTHATLLLLVEMKSENVKEFLKKINKRIKMTERVIEIVRILVDIVLESVITALKFVSFIPSFFGTVNSFVLEDEGEFELNGEKRENNEENTSSVTGITIIRVAAFAFAIVSWKATADGLSEYVFGSGWQSSVVSFAIQAILFVFNLKLPFYFHRIGENTPDREKKKYRYGTKKGLEKGTYKTTVFQRVIIGFYIVVLCSSSVFSFVYICENVVYEHQSGYIDDNTILASSYRKILNDTEDYITEDTKAMKILASKLLSELKGKYIVLDNKNNSVSKQDLEAAVNEAQDSYDIAKEEYETAKDDANSYKEEMDSYADSRNGTTWHDRQDEWENKYKKAKEDWEEAVKSRNEKKGIYEEKKTALTEAQNVLKNYKDSQQTVIANFLSEMLKVDSNPNPNTNLLREYISELNSMIAELGTDADIANNYGELVETIQILTIVVNDYISLVETTYDKNTGIKYLMEHVMDNTAIPDPTSKSFKRDYSSWRTTWNSKLYNLENLIQNLPEFSENEKKELQNTVINVEILENYIINDKINVLDELRRSKVSDINIIEKAFLLLFGKYWFTAWFSFGLAVFFDISSLLAGLFIYGIRKKSQ